MSKSEETPSTKGNLTKDDEDHGKAYMRGFVECMDFMIEKWEEDGDGARFMARMKIYRKKIQKMTDNIDGIIDDFAKEKGLKRDGQI